MLKSLNINILLITIVIGSAVGQIEFPDHFEVDKKKSNLAGRVPLFSPTRCKANELLYPGDQVDDWICDCAPAAIYHPDSDACYIAFRKGPCKEDEMLVLAPNNVIPECIKNECSDGEIRINKICYKFGDGAPCRNAHLSYVLGVDPTTLMVDCVRQSISLASRFGDDGLPQITVDLIKPCARGSKRATKGDCANLNI
ncbi:uncharacterized protein LOC119685402 [Teleopsis dalmanni]|uniref:uncharacterized protein LOC119685402 n=1 Tax=Teleopsis dalmanni TaxID=139649 RepID=UPI0018CDB07A|nr:uncharacterized protein LOC119685402 [Teleopsis dalmanni]